MSQTLGRRAFLMGSSATILAGCAERGAFRPTDPSRVALTRQVFYATNRIEPQSEDGIVGRGRALQYAVLDIATPPDRTPGELAFSGADAFTLRSSSNVRESDIAQTLREVIPDDAERDDPLMIWVHGFNNTPAEAVYRQVQIVQDVGHQGPAVSFVWPSAALPPAYIHDRDSALQARDALADLLVTLRAAWKGPIVLIAHSLGCFLTLEALGRLRLSGVSAPQINGLLLVQPDIAPDVFEAQIGDAKPLPERTVLMVAQDDPVLRFSARISTQPERVGATGEIARYEALGLEVIDLTPINDAVVPHLVPFTSPTVLTVFRRFVAAGGPPNFG